MSQVTLRPPTARPAAAGWASPDRIPRWVTRWALLLGVLLALEALGRSGWINSALFVPPSQMILALGQEAANGALGANAVTTFLEIFLSFGIGVLLGVPIGIGFWRRPWLGSVFQPYLVSLYAMPLVLFYPLLLALLGLGIAPIVVIGSIMAAIPVIMNTAIAFGGIRATLIRTGRSLNCTYWQLYRKVLFPAAVPLMFTGIKMGFIYALLGAIAMEFVMAQSGLGFAVHYDYNNFETAQMYGYILFILAVAVFFNAILSAIERQLRHELHL